MTCETCHGEGGWEAAASSTNYLWKECPDCKPDTLDDDHPLWLVNEQIKGLLGGDGADEDHEDVISFLLTTGLPRGTVDRIHMAIVCAEKP